MLGRMTPGLIRITRRFILGLLGWSAGLLVCLASGTAAEHSAPPQQQPAEAVFSEVPPSASGITWVQENGMSEEHYLPETMGPGGAFLDYDNDGWLDIYLINHGECDFWKPTEPIRNALYKNNGDGTFTDVTEKAGVEARTFGTGIAVADFDNDGDADIFLTAYGPTILYRNRGDGTFENITQKAGVEYRGWTTSTAWLDYDNDSHLDLFVGNFVEFGVNQHISCGLNPLGKAYYCVPKVFNATINMVFRNKKDGTFELTSKDTAIGRTPGKALGSVATDVNNDGWMDIFIANDTMQDYLFINRGDNEWEEVGVFAGVGFSVNGTVQSGMGVDSADFDEDGFQDLFVANIDHQDYSLFRNNGDETFDDVAVSHGITKLTNLMSGWGVRFIDFDNDGDLDLLMANGHPDDMISEYSSQVTYKEPLKLLENVRGELRDISASAGQIFSRDMSSRGMAVGDINNDGRIDALVINNGEAPVLLKNTDRNDNHWLGVKLVGKTCNREAVGATIRWSAGGERGARFKTNGGSFMSAHDTRMLIGLGEKTTLDWLEIQWPKPSTRIERFTGLQVDQYITIEEGAGSLVR